MGDRFIDKGGGGQKGPLASVSSGGFGKPQQQQPRQWSNFPNAAWAIQNPNLSVESSPARTRGALVIAGN